eukprot:TRINITY_DN27872_c0_g1_i1.p1 TRINITY_DN27872_c0_g1~~TRINITY_DN27872_c0_g1_i1.p1  ORF type:complete len:878 (+),score=81.68 TRINITY_DN27872_c0_g1_i1:105-2738(+)
MSRGPGPGQLYYSQPQQQPWHSPATSPVASTLPGSTHWSDGEDTDSQFQLQLDHLSRLSAVQSQQIEVLQRKITDRIKKGNGSGGGISIAGLPLPASMFGDDVDVTADVAYSDTEESFYSGVGGGADWNPGYVHGPHQTPQTSPSPLPSNIQFSMSPGDLTWNNDGTLEVTGSLRLDFPSNTRGGPARTITVPITSLNSSLTTTPATSRPASPPTAYSHRHSHTHGQYPEVEAGVYADYNPQTPQYNGDDGQYGEDGEDYPVIGAYTHDAGQNYPSSGSPVGVTPFPKPCPNLKHAVSEPSSVPHVPNQSAPLPPSRMQATNHSHDPDVQIHPQHQQPQRGGRGHGRGSQQQRGAPRQQHQPKQPQPTPSLTNSSRSSFSSQQSLPHAPPNSPHPPTYGTNSTRKQPAVRSSSPTESVHPTTAYSHSEVSGTSSPMMDPSRASSPLLLPPSLSGHSLSSAPTTMSQQQRRGSGTARKQHQMQVVALDDNSLQDDTWGQVTSPQRQKPKKYSPMAYSPPMNSNQVNVAIGDDEEPAVVIPGRKLSRGTSPDRYPFNSNERAAIPQHASCDHCGNHTSKEHGIALGWALRNRPEMRKLYRQYKLMKDDTPSLVEAVASNHCRICRQLSPSHSRPNAISPICSHTKHQHCSPDMSPYSPMALALEDDECGMHFHHQQYNPNNNLSSSTMDTSVGYASPQQWANDETQMEQRRSDRYKRIATMRSGSGGGGGGGGGGGQTSQMSQDRNKSPSRNHPISTMPPTKEKSTQYMPLFHEVFHRQPTHRHTGADTALPPESDFPINVTRVPPYPNMKLPESDRVGRGDGFSQGGEDDAASDVSSERLDMMLREARMPFAFKLPPSPRQEPEEGPAMAVISQPVRY